MSCIISHGSNDCKTILFFILNFVALLAYLRIFVPFCLHKKCVVIRKSGSLFEQVHFSFYLSKSPFFKSSLARASGLVLMSNPAQTLKEHPSGHPNFLLNNFLTCQFEAYNPFFTSQYNSHDIV